MNAHQSRFDVSVINSNCHTLTINLDGSSMTSGIKVDTQALEPGLYMSSNLYGKVENSFYRYVLLQRGRNPTVVKGKIFKALLNGFYLTEKGFLDQSKQYLLHLKVFDQQVKKVKNGNWEVVTLAGNPTKRELVWKKHGEGTVGLEGLFIFFPGDMVAVQYPGGVCFVSCTNKSGLQLHRIGEESEPEKAWNKLIWVEKEQEREKLLDKVRDLAATFPNIPTEYGMDYWPNILDFYSSKRDGEGVLDIFASTFFEELFEIIAGNVHKFGVDEDGRWYPWQVFQMHTLAAVTKQLPKEYLRRARKALADAARELHAELPLIILQKFEMHDPISVAEKSAKNKEEGDKSSLAEIKAAKAAKKAELHKNQPKKGSSAEIPLHPNHQKNDKKGEKKNRR